MDKKLIFSLTDEKGREFKLIGDLENIQKEIIKLQTETDEEGYHYWDGGDERPSNADDRFKEMVEVSAYFDEDFDWTEIINTLPKKKNGTFSKGRVHRLHRARSFSSLWEDSYGYGAPEVRIKVLSDLEAHVEFGWYVEKY
ncbi:gp209 [Bacillus phage G]|uniref:Gp209 n=1 Tax=Bacillus phage G TaxID=2884420 RepID=G3MBS5_9CAUD|nr:gp209 [Bacillus phage G]AEO93468.1 gp209 [Bacillus phage G]